MQSLLGASVGVAAIVAGTMVGIRAIVLKRPISIHKSGPFMGASSDVTLSVLGTIILSCCGIAVGAASFAAGALGQKLSSGVWPFVVTGAFVAAIGAVAFLRASR